jgi:hypothetical protein
MYRIANTGKRPLILEEYTSESSLEDISRSPDQTSNTGSMIPAPTMDITTLEGEDLLKYLDSLITNTDDPLTSTLSSKQIREIADACVKTLQKHGCIMHTLLDFLKDTYTSTNKTLTSTTPSDHPILLIIQI